MTNIDLDATIDTIPLACLDVETTGLDPLFGDRICEIAIIQGQGLRILSTWSQLINPERAMSPSAERVHGITDEMLQQAPPFREIANHVLNLLDQKLVVGHNVVFDLAFLYAELRRIERDPPHIIALDTLTLARRILDLSHYSLDQVCQALGIPFSVRHRALPDALVTHQVFVNLVNRLRAQGVETAADLIRAQGGPLRFQNGTIPSNSPGVPAQIHEAIENNWLLQISYKDAQGQETERIIRPLGVIERYGRLYLVAYCFLRNDQRTFSIARITSLRAMPDPNG